mmetsp:Transcript_30133/g.39686  ORF Transcript_30133/g.39686 Transcript_30133/m.39686 type:complete len:423 (+) Transcript_30133:1-1269(+)
MAFTDKGKVFFFFLCLQLHNDIVESFGPFQSLHFRALKKPKLFVQQSERFEEKALFTPEDSDEGSTMPTPFEKSFVNSTKSNWNNNISNNSSQSVEFQESILPAENSEVHQTNPEMLPYAKRIADYVSLPKNELIDAGLVLLSSFAVAIGTLPTTILPQFISTGIFYLEEFLSYFFCFGFILRWYAVGNLSLSYFAKPLPFVDFFASVMPLVLTKGGLILGGLDVPAWCTANSSALVNLRLLRILRLQELLVDRETFNSIAESLGIDSRSVRPYQLQLARVLISIFTLFSISTGLIYTAEHEVNPMIPDYFTALYFGLTTLTTVGFGDITPITFPGRLVVMGSILIGVAIIPVQAAQLVEALLDFQAERRQKKMLKNTIRTRMEGFQEDQMVDPRISCTCCGRRSHRSDASYCWSCGAKLWQ